jgi:hypothetical protein
MAASASEWRTRTLESELQGLRISLRQARNEVQVLRSQLDASQGELSQLASALEAARLPAVPAASANADAAAASETDARAADDAPRSAAAVAAAAVHEPRTAAAEPEAAAEHTQAPPSDCVTHEVEPGVFVTVNAGHVLRRVRFDRRTFTDEQAQEWWETNKSAVMGRLGLVLPTARRRKARG